MAMGKKGPPEQYAVPAYGDDSSDMDMLRTAVVGVAKANDAIRRAQFEHSEAQRKLVRVIIQRPDADLLLTPNMARVRNMVM
jgi:hypothetical protein